MKHNLFYVPMILVQWTQLSRKVHSSQPHLSDKDMCLSLIEFLFSAGLRVAGWWGSAQGMISQCQKLDDPMPTVELLI